MVRLSWKRWFMVAVVLAACGCAETLTYERYEMINTGDSPEVVQATLGKPLTKTDMTWAYNDYDREITAFIYFQDDKVSGKRWDDPEHGQQGGNPNVNEPGDADELNIQQIK